MKEEGFNVLYSGLAPALLRQAIYGTVKYGLYYTIKDVVGGEESPLKNVSIAVVAGSVSASIANPTDVLKVRLQSKSAPVVSPIPGPDKKVIRVSLYNCFRDIYVREGVGGLWRGMMPTASRAALVAGVQVQVLHVQSKATGCPRAKMFLIARLARSDPRYSFLGSIRSILSLTSSHSSYLRLF